MVQDLSYTTISYVIDSWERLRRTKNYEEVIGTILFQHLFEKCPKAKVLFGFPVDMDPQCSDLLKSRRFLVHKTHLVQMLDTSLDLLGPDIELLTEVMTDLGKKHVRFGVTSDMFPFMGEALLFTLEKTLGGRCIHPISSIRENT